MIRNKIRVCIVDDHPVVRDGLKGLVSTEADMEVVGEAFDGEGAIRGAVELRPDVVVMDVSMPGMSGIEATRRVRAECPEIKIVALTAHEGGGYLQLIFGAGACGYVLKRTATSELIGAIRHAVAGNTYVDPAIAGQLLTGSAAALAGKETVELSEREEKVLMDIAQGYSNKQIAARLKISVKTVETYKARAMEKLGARSRVDIVRHATGRGWLATD